MLKDNDIPYDDCHAMAAAKTQRNILRDYFMNEGQVHGNWTEFKIKNIVIL